MKTAIAGALLCVLCGCTSYLAPGPRADLRAFAPGSIQEGFAAKPVAPFPAAIAVVRIQGAGYSNYRLRRGGGAYGSDDGRYVVVLTRELGEDAAIERLARLPRVAGITGVNRMLLPGRIDGEMAIREAAARLQADLILVYTFDTSFLDTDLAKPLTVVTLGLAPTRKVVLNTTASALLLDTRTGFVYATVEVTKAADTLSTSWGSADAVDEARRRTEGEAFDGLVDELAATWSRVLERYAAKP